jgi:hypothetical protein
VRRVKKEECESKCRREIRERREWREAAMSVVRMEGDERRGGASSHRWVSEDGRTIR